MLPRIIELGCTGGDETFRLRLIDSKEYLVEPMFALHSFCIKREPDGIWLQTDGEPVEPRIIESLADDLNDIDSQEFEFPIIYEGEAVLCRVGTGESGFGVLMNNRLVAEVNISDDGFTWEVTKGGPLDEGNLYEIGQAIEHHTA